MQFKLPLGTFTYYIRMQVQCLAIQLLIQLFANAACEAVDDGLSAWVHAIQELNGILISRLQPT